MGIAKHYIGTSSMTLHISSNFHFHPSDSLLGDKCSLILAPDNGMAYCGQSYKQFTIVIYDSRVIIWCIFKSGTARES